MICVPDQSIQERAKTLPVSYLHECRVVAQIRSEDGFWCFTVRDYQALRRKYAKYAISSSHEHEVGEPISGCCDRADQF
jgi:hypothetical protein